MRISYVHNYGGNVREKGYADPPNRKYILIGGEKEMKASIIKKSMVCALAVSLVMAPVMGVSAETTKTTSGNSVVVEETGAETVAEAVALIPTTSSVGGVKSTVSGAFLVNKVNGVAVTTPLSNIVSGYGIGSGETAYAMVWDLDPKKSNLAQQVIDLAAASQGATAGPALNIEIGKKSGGKFSLLSTEGPAIRIAVGIPANFAQDGKTYAVVRVRPGGAVSILADVDDNPNTVTFDTTAGAGAYAIIRY